MGKQKKRTGEGALEILSGRTCLVGAVGLGGLGLFDFGSGGSRGLGLFVFAVGGFLELADGLAEAFGEAGELGTAEEEEDDEEYPHPFHAAGKQGEN